MIIDRLENLANYAHLGRNFQTAAAFASTHNLYDLPVGRTEVDGENVFINVSEEAYTRTEPFWEAHKRYADMQIILTGAERFGWGSQVSYGELNGDLMLCTASSGFFFELSKGQMVVYLPMEGHSPCNPAQEGLVCKKAVIKVLMND